jgi:hypothetical protein
MLTAASVQTGTNCGCQVGQRNAGNAANAGFFRLRTRKRGDGGTVSDAPAPKKRPPGRRKGSSNKTVKIAKEAITEACPDQS